ncbi:MAG: alpha/beta hydrolase-fold protein [Halioglobus sp.]
MFIQLRNVIILIITTAVLTACSNSSDNNNDTADDSFQLQGCADTGTCASNPPLTLGGERPAMVQIPSNYDINTRYPLVMVLHGRGVDGYIQAVYLGLFDRIDSKQFILIYPDGTFVYDGRRQWRVVPTCCDTPPDEAAALSDVSYLTGLIEEAAATYSIDTTRIGLIGHSSGGFMSLTMTCEASHLVTAIVNLAGSTFVDFDNCRPATERVSVLTVHGTADDTVPYNGLDGVYLSAPAVADRYAMLAGCDTNNPIARTDFDLVASIDGAETSRVTWPDCLAGTEVEFWTMNDGPHIPVPWVPQGLDAFVDWLLEHPRQ